MKAYRKLLMLAMTAPIVASCEVEPLPTYSGQDNVYFAYADASALAYIVDNMTVHFGYNTPQLPSYEVAIPVKLLGAVKPVNRPVAFELKGTAVEGTDVEALRDSSYIPAGQAAGSVRLRLLNTDNLNGKMLYLTVHLLPSADFAVDYNEFFYFPTMHLDTIYDARQFYIRFDNARDMPNLWAANEFLFLSTFGTYSDKKLELLCTLFKLTPDYFTYDAATEDPSTVYNQRFPGTLSVGWVRIFNRYLNEMKEKGTPVLEDDGTEMKSGNDKVV